MSTAVFPLGMKTHMPASGYNHKSTLYNLMYVPWKGTGRNSFPVGTAPGHIRPLTNKDPGNVFQTGFGLPRPMKHYRKGRVVPPEPITGVPNLESTSPFNRGVPISIAENGLINYNINRFVKSSKPTPLGGARSSSGLLNDMMGMPGGYTVKLNPNDEIDGVTQQNKNCKSCEGIGIVASYKPNLYYLEDNPEQNTTNRLLCCNEEYKAKRRVIYANTFLKKNYYTTTKQYLQNRCKSVEQKAFNFLVNKQIPNTEYQDNPYYSFYNDPSLKPGSPLSLTNTYVGQCQLNAQLYVGTVNAMITQLLYVMEARNIFTKAEVNAFYNLNINSVQGFWDWLNGQPEAQRVPALTITSDYLKNPYNPMPVAGPSYQTGCQLIVYNPNNYQYAQQGAVTASTRILKLMVDTISTNAASIQGNNNTGPNLVTANQLYRGDNYNDMDLQKNKEKNKAPGCNSNWPLNMSQSRQYQNKKYCSFRQLPVYQIPASKPLTYRFYRATVFSSNHFNQTANTYLNTAGTTSKQQIRN